ncbi:MAG: type II toxin-antitoxin system HigA family antitoxin [Lachnospira sp.]
MARIENKQQYDWAVKRVEELLPLVNDSTPLDNAASIELELLSNMVADYSEEHYSIGSPTLPQILRLRMEEMGLTIRNIASMIGVTPDNMKSYLDGEKEPTLSIGRNICRQLDVDANIVLGV